MSRLGNFPGIIALVVGGSVSTHYRIMIIWQARAYVNHLMLRMRLDRSKAAKLAEDLIDNQSK